MLASKNPVLSSLGTPTLASPTGAPPLRADPDQNPSITISEHQRHTDPLVYADVQALSSISDYLVAHQRPYRLQVASFTSFADLRAGPTVVIGGFDNPWTLHTLQSLRFRFWRDHGGPARIEDQRNRGLTNWSVDFTQSYAELNEDHAIVARLTSQDTHQPVLVIAGIGENGTRAASELMTDPDAFNTLIALRRGHSNFEIVLGTKVINGISGPPTVLAEEEW